MRRLCVVKVTFFRRILYVQPEQCQLGKRIEIVRRNSEADCRLHPRCVVRDRRRVKLRYKPRLDKPVLKCQQKIRQFCLSVRDCKLPVSEFLFDTGIDRDRACADKADFCRHQGFKLEFVDDRCHLRADKQPQTAVNHDCRDGNSSGHADLYIIAVISDRLCGFFCSRIKLRV